MMNHVTENMGFVPNFLKNTYYLDGQSEMLKSFDAKFVKMTFKNVCVLIVTHILRLNGHAFHHQLNLHNCLLKWIENFWMCRKRMGKHSKYEFIDTRSFTLQRYV